jgi:hypothetical protein
MTVTRPRSRPRARDRFHWARLSVPTPNPRGRRGARGRSLEALPSCSEPTIARGSSISGPPCRATRTTSQRPPRLWPRLWPRRPSWASSRRAEKKQVRLGVVASVGSHWPRMLDWQGSGCAHSTGHQRRAAVRLRRCPLSMSGVARDTLRSPSSWVGTRGDAVLRWARGGAGRRSGAAICARRGARDRRLSVVGACAAAPLGMVRFVQACTLFAVRQPAETGRAAAACLNDFTVDWAPVSQTRQRARVSVPEILCPEITH